MHEDKKKKRRGEREIDTAARNKRIKINRRD